MHQPLVWMLAGLAACVFAGWRIRLALRRAAGMRAAREAAMALALAQAEQAARAAAAQRLPATPHASLASQDSQAARLAVSQARAAQAARSVARAEAERVLAAESALRLAAHAGARRETQRRAAAVAATAPAPAIAFKTPAQTRILVVDDSKMVRVKTSRLLLAAGFQVATAVDGLDALQQMAAAPVDLVITDVDMPGLDGFGLVERIRAERATQALPLVMITSAEDEHASRALACGVGLVLGKPYDEQALVAHLRSFAFTVRPGAREPATADPA